jgi:hypothetical protein
MGEHIRQLLDALTEADRNEILRDLLAQFLAGLDEERVILDRQGKALGYFLPVNRRLQLRAGTAARPAKLDEVVASASGGPNFTEMIEQLKGSN